jgi:hypothetical protein
MTYLSSEQILMVILSKPNGSAETSVGFIQDLHKFTRGNVALIKQIQNPRESIEAINLKNQILSILKEYDQLNRQPINSKRTK